MSDEALQKAIERVRKLMAHVNSQTANEHEAAVAAAKAQAIIAEYNINESMINPNRPLNAIEPVLVVATPPARWRRVLGVWVAQMYFCGYFFNPTTNDKGTAVNEHWMVGERHNLVVAASMFEYLVDTIDRLARMGARKLPHKERSSYRVDFRDACTMRLVQRIHELIELAKAGGLKTDTGTTLPVLASLYDQAARRFNDWKEDQGGFSQVKNKKPKTKGVGGIFGAADGRKAADTISLEKQIEQERAAHLLPRS